MFQDGKLSYEFAKFLLEHIFALLGMIISGMNARKLDRLMRHHNVRLHEPVPPDSKPKRARTRA